MMAAVAEPPSAAAAASGAAAAAVDVAPAPAASDDGYARATAPTVSPYAEGHGSPASSSSSAVSDWTTAASAPSTPPQTPPLDWGEEEGGRSIHEPSAGAAAPHHQQPQQEPASIFLALPYLFVPFLTPQDCLALAAAGKVLFPYHHHVRVLSLRPPHVAHPHQHYTGLRRLVKRLQPGIRALQLRPNKASQMEGPMLRVVGDLIASGLLTTLTTLDAAGVSLRPVGARTLAAALAGGGCAGLLHLNLNNTDIQDTGATEIAKALHNGLGAALAPLLPTTPPNHTHPYFTFPPFPPAAAHTAPAAAAAPIAAAAAGGYAMPAAAVPPPPPRPLSPSPLSTTSTAAAALYAGGSLYPPFPACPRLQSLSLAGTGLTDAGLIALADLLPSGCPHLQALDLSNTSASAVGWTRGVEVLMGPQGLTTLRTIRLPRAGSAGGQALRSVARALASGGGLCLHELDFGGLCITDGGVLDLARAFRRRREIVEANPGVAHAPLHRLVLTGGCVGPSGLSALLGEIAAPEGGLAALAHLDISGAQLNGGPVTLGILLRFLRDGAGPGLKSLGLARCGLGNPGVEALAAALAEGRCTGLEELRLGANGCRAPVAARLVEALVVRRACPALRLLSLDLNLLGAEGVKDILLRLALWPWGDEREGEERPPAVWLSLRGMGFSPASMMVVPAEDGYQLGAHNHHPHEEPQHRPSMTAAAAFAAYRRLLAAIPAERVRVDVRAA